MIKNKTSKQRKYFFNENYFDNINTEEKAYWLGFIFADGSVNKYSLNLFIQKRDEELLKKLAASLNYNGSIKTSVRESNNKTYEYVRLSLCSKKMIKSLNDIGITPNKTKHPHIPKITDDLFIPFLRGLSDGDGMVYFNKDKKISCWCLIVHEYLVSFLTEKINKLIKNFTFQIGKHRTTSYMRVIACCGNKNTLCLLKTLYQNSTIHLSRKHEKFKSLLNWTIENSNNPYRIKNKLTKYRGVTLEKRTGKYYATIRIKNKPIHLGTFITQEEAAVDYNNAATKYLGNKAILNIIQATSSASTTPESLTIPSPTEK